MWGCQGGNYCHTLVEMAIILNEGFVGRCGVLKVVTIALL